MDDRSVASNTARYVRYLVLAVGVFALALAARTLANVLLLLFGAVVVAVILRAAAWPLRRWTPLPDAPAVLTALLALLALGVLTGWLFGAQVGGEVDQLRTELPRAWAGLQDRLGRSEAGRQLLEAARGASLPGGRDIASRLAGFAGRAANAASNLLIVIFAGVYLALKPARYREGAVMLFPKSRADQVRGVFDDSGRALKLWLIGQLASMLTVGLLTWGGLSLAGVPSAAALGLLAGLAEFVPIAGPILAAAPGLLLAASAGPDTALWALVVYVGVQQVESNLITPLVEKRTVSLPPVLTLFGVLALGVLFGPLGVVLATPLVVVAYVAVKRAYVRDTLDYAVSVPGAQDSG